MVGCYGKFIAQVAVKRKPLTKLTSKGNPDWSRFIMHTDFSGAGLGAVLAHEDEGREYVVEFASRTCQGMEPNYASYEGECLAMLYGTSKFRYYLFGRQFVVVTYHWPLEWLKNTAQLRGKLARWAMRLSEYDFVPKLSAWARRCVLDAAHEGAANGDLVAVTSELSAGPQRGDTYVGTEAMAELQAGNVNIRVASEAAEPYAGDAEAEVDNHACRFNEGSMLQRPDQARHTNRHNVGDSSHPLCLGPTMPALNHR
eukprot:jgi/Tetstr1/442352/TSEL_003184.t1